MIPGSGRSPGEGNGNPLQYSCLENPMDGRAWQAIVHQVTKSWTLLRDFTSLHFTSLHFMLPGSSAGKASTCNAGYPSSISSLGSFPGEGIVYPLQYSWASLVAQMVKNLPAMWETWVQSLGWEDPLEKGMTTHSSILAWRIPVDRGAWQVTVCGVTKSQT